MTLVFPNHVRRVPNKMDSLVWNMKLSSHISSVNYFTSAVKENRCNEQLIIQNNHLLNPIPLLNIFRGRSAMVGFTHNVNWVHWPVFHVGPHQPSCTPRLWVSRQLPAPNTWPLTVQYHVQVWIGLGPGLNRSAMPWCHSLDSLGIYLSQHISAESRARK